MSSNDRKRHEKIDSSKFLQVVEMMDHSELHFMKYLINLKINHDPLKFLPPHTVLQSISQLDLKSLFRLARTNKSWASVIFPVQSECNNQNGLVHPSHYRQLWVHIYMHLNETGQITPLITRLLQRYASDLKSLCPWLLYNGLKTNAFLIRNWLRNLAKTITFECHGSNVITSVYLDPVFSSRIITASDDNTAMIWDMNSLFDAAVASPINNIRSSSPSASQLTSEAQYEGGLLQSNVNRIGTDHGVVNLIGHNGGIWALAVAYNLIITGSTDRSIGIWDAITGRLRHQLVGHTSTVRCVEVIHDVNLLVSGSRDQTLRVWDWKSGLCLKVLQGHQGSVRCIASIYSGFIVSGSYDNSLKIWDVKHGNLINTLTGHQSRIYTVCTVHKSESSIKCYCFSNTTSSHRSQAHHLSDYLIYSGGQDSVVRVWDAHSGQCIKVIEGFKGLIGLMEIKYVAGLHLLVIGSTDGIIQIWDAANIVHLSTMSNNYANSSNNNSNIQLNQSSTVTCLSFNGNILITGSEHTVRLWDLRSLIYAYNSQLWQYNSYRVETNPLTHNNLIDINGISGQGRCRLASQSTGQVTNIDASCSASLPPPKFIGNLIEHVDMVWRVAVSDRHAVIAYQIQNSTRIRILDYLTSCLI